MLALRTRRPEASAALEAALDQACTAGPDGLLPLCRARVRMLLGGVPETRDAKTAALADYAHSPLFDDIERLALEFTEQYVLDVAAMPDDLVHALREKLGAAGLYAFAMGLYAVDQAERLALSTTVHPGNAE